MAIETTINTIADLDQTVPTGAEPKSDGDNHIRNVKKALKQTFPNIAGPVTATHAQLNLLTGKTDVATAADIAAASLGATIPGINDPANAGKFLKAPGVFEAIAIPTAQPGSATLNRGNSGTAAQIVNYLEGGVPTEGQTITATGIFNLSAVGFPAGRIAGILLRAVNWGAFPGITSTGITWVKADKTQTTVYADAGLNLPASGTGLIALFSYGDGTIYGKAA